MKKIILFGASRLGIFAYEYLKEKYNILYFVDNDNKKWGEKIGEVEIISPNEIKEKVTSDFFVVITSSYLDEIEKQLVIDLGIFNYYYFKVYLSSNINGKGYLSYKEVNEALKGDFGKLEYYLEKKGNKIGRTQEIIDEIKEVVDLNKLDSVCEIGPGSGLFLNRIYKETTNLSNYIIYEPNVEWASMLSKNYSIKRRYSNGVELSQEEDQSIDLIHAHAVFVYLNSVNTFKYFKDMLRVSKKGGYIIFDFLPSENLTYEIINKWLDSGFNYPVFLPSQTIKAFFEKNGASLVKEFQVKYACDFVTYHIYQV